MNITRLSIKRPVGITMVVAFFVVLGLYSYYRIGVELLPALNTPYVTVTVKYPGASAESVEQEVVKPVEDALSSVSGVKKITSTASYERARVTLELDFGTNSDTAAIDASKKVDAIKNKLPDEADSPVVVKRDMNAKPIVELAVLSNHSLADTYTETENVFSEVLQQAEGVSEVELHGGRDKEVAIDVDRDKMAAYKLTLAKISSAIKNENQLVPSGSVFTETTKSDVRVVAQFKKASDIEKIQVQNTAGEMIPLTSVATVQERDARAERFGRLNGEDAINVLVYKNSDANVVETAANVIKSVEKLRKTYPDYQFVVVSNDADYVQNSLHSTMNTLMEGLITTGLVLFLFLRGWRSTAAVMIAIPTSLISTFFVMYLFGFTFNMMSLMGMTLCVGILVDDSIVVLENIVRHLKMGEKPDDAAEKGRTEIGMAAIAITLCDAAVFMPIAFMQGMTGQYFRQFGLTIVFAGLFSLFVSFTLTPMLASRFFKNGYHPGKSRVWQFMDHLEERAQYYYVAILGWSLHHQKKLLLSILAVFIAVVSLVPLGAGGGGAKNGGGALQIELRSNNADEIDAAAEKTMNILKNDIKGVTDVNSSYVEGMPELRLTVNREKLKAYGTSLQDVDTAFASAISGLSAGELKNDATNGGQDTNIKVRFKDAANYKASDVARVPLSASGKLIYLGDVADIKNGRGPVSIRRVDKQRSVAIGANLSGRPIGDVTKDVNKALKDANLGDGVTYQFKGQATKMNETFSELLSALFLALVLIYMLLAVLYESVITPFIRMFSLPLGIIGSILMLFLTHNTLNLFSMIGILVMDGIVAKNGTLLIDYTLTLMDRGKTALEAVIEAGRVRLKPIFMTTITMMVGMTPMALAMTPGSESRVSMAWVIIGGLLTSTVFTLIVIPIIFLFFARHTKSRRL